MATSILTADRQFTPKYVGLARELVDHIASERLTIGDRLGTEEGLGQRYGVSRVTVRQALDLLESEGYVARKRARGTFVTRQVEPHSPLRTTSGRVLLVCSNEQKSHCDEDSAFCTVLRAIEQSLARQNLMVQIMSVGQSPGEDRARLESLLTQGELSGILSIGPCVDAYSDLLTDTNVVTTCTFRPSPFPWVGDDIATASQQSVAYLLNKGHSRIAMLCGRWIDGDAFAGFASGMKAAMDAAGVPINRLLLLHNYAGESLEELAVQLLSHSPAPTAVFCENWRVCEAVIKACSHLGLSIPGDLSVVGYGQNVSQLREPVRFTAYVPDTARIGELAGELLGRLIGGKTPPPAPVVVTGSIIEGESVLELD